MNNNKVYFASDFHLGAPNFNESLQREKLICKWLDTIKHDAKEIYLVGDIFDFWYEYKYTAPKHFIRFLGKIAELSDLGIKITFFSGNHDLWMNNYLITELNITIHHNPIELNYEGKTFFIGHGDGLGPGDKGYKFLKKIFTSKICQWLYSRLHPNLAFYIAQKSSKSSRASTGTGDEKFLTNEDEWLYVFCKEMLRKKHYDFFIFGHRHLPLNIALNNSKYINLGDWIKYYTYAVFDGKELELKEFKSVV
ncbi:MAG: UDP-2,3-diacylglucosamine diphosphatase [Bacteroidetes bacterium]|nr:UDP-2,3-diacylglucosamine diphosphatase [Bacteroidota bacterium]